MKPQLPPETVIEVVMRKEMTVDDYMKLRGDAIKKGWRCQGYQRGYYQKSPEIKSEPSGS